MTRAFLPFLISTFSMLALPAFADTYTPQPGDRMHPEPGGLHIHSRDGESTWNVAFGTPFHQVMTALDTILERDFTLSFPAECPAGPMIIVTYPDTIDLIFQEDRLQGWALPQQSPLITHDGIGWGSTQDHLQSTYSVTSVDSTLGNEFYMDGLSGIIEDAMVAYLWSGTNCIFR